MFVVGVTELVKEAERINGLGVASPCSKYLEPSDLLVYQQQALG